MPAWWGRKSTKSKDDSHPQYDAVLTPKSSKHSSSKNKRYSFEDSAASRGSPRGFESDCCEKRGLPLPRPSVSDHGVVLGSGSASGSVSSVSSSGSDDPHSVVAYRRQSEMKSSTGSRSPNPGSRSPYPGSRSPGPASRGPSRPTSPLHPRFGGMNMDSPSGDGKNQCHPLPLPPGSPTSPSSMPSTPGTPSTLSTWKKGKLLGRGTFGHVYLGFNSDSGQMCAIKEVKVVSDDQASKECLRQLNQEIGLLKRLSHPNIVRYYGSEMVWFTWKNNTVCEETLSVYLEYVSGGSIHKLLQEYGAFKEPVIQNYTRQILSGLSYLHGRNTVHRDIKGANILVDPNGEIKLADFGMAKHITACSSMLSFKGSPYWMAPEVVMYTNGYSLAVDIWSLGCTIIEMASSKPPWSQYEGVAAIFKIGNSKDMPDIPDHLSSDAKNFIKSCLQRDPSARPTASELLKHPFICDQATTRVANIKVTRDAFPHTFDGSRTPPVLELHSSRGNMTSSDGDFAMKPLVTNTRALKGSRDDCRMITSSLPVSPSCSPHRQYGPAHKSCFLSPPHPTYAGLGQNGYNLGDFSLHPMRPNTAYSQDPFFETSILNAQLPGSSPRKRPI